MWVYTTATFVEVSPRKINKQAWKSTITKYLLLVKFCGIPSSGWRGEVENVSVDQMPEWSSLFSDKSEKHKILDSAIADKQTCCKQATVCTYI